MVGKLRAWPGGVHSNDKLLKFIMERERRVPTIHWGGGGGVVWWETEQNRVMESLWCVWIKESECVLCYVYDLICVLDFRCTTFGIGMCVVLGLWNVVGWWIGGMAPKMDQEFPNDTPQHTPSILHSSIKRASFCFCFFMGLNNVFIISIDDQ